MAGDSVFSIPALLSEKCRPVEKQDESISGAFCCFLGGGHTLHCYFSSYAKLKIYSQISLKLNQNIFCLFYLDTKAISRPKPNI